MANLPANPGEALWIGGDLGRNHFNVGIGGPGGDLDHTDYSQAAIEDGFTLADYFYLDGNGDVVFKQYVQNGRTSTNTKYPRTECRELQPNGTSKAAWSSGSGTHYGKGISKIDHVPSAKPWVVFFQVHDADSDFFRVQTEDGAIVCRRTPPGGSEIRTVLRSSYTVGAWIAWEWRFESGTLTIKLDGTTVLTASGMSKTGCYEKFGCYNQVNNRSDGGSAPTGEYCQVTVQRGSKVTWHTGYPEPTTPTFGGTTDPGGGPGGGAGNDTQAPTVPGNFVGIRDTTKARLLWTESTDNVGVTGYRVYRYSASGSAEVIDPGSPTGGSGGPLTDRTGVSYTNGAGITSTAHIYAADLDWTRPVGVLVYADGSGEAGLADTSSTYLMAGTSGLIAVAKKYNMVLVTPRAPGNGCTDGDGVCWYLPSFNGVTRAQKTQWLDDLIQNEILAKYNVDVTRAVVAGFSSGAENAMGLYGPAFAASWMEDGLLLGISYGSSPDQYGVTDTYTAGFRANVAAVWDVRGGDETTAVADSLEGYNWYVADGFATTLRTVTPGGAHDRPGEFGSIVDRYIAQYVRAQGAVGESSSILGKSIDGAGSTVSSADKVIASSAVAPASGTLSTGHFRAWLSSSGTTTAKLLVYANSGTAPGALLATSDQITITSTTPDSVRDFTFSGANQIDIVGGTTYWVGVTWDDPGTPSITYSRDETSGRRLERSDITYGTPPNPFGTATGTFTGPIDAWCDVVSGTGAGTGGAGGFVLLATTTTTQYVDTGLTDGGSYVYAVSAIDAAGNESARTGSVTVVPGTPDADAPTVPENLAATAGDRRVALSWDASTDPVTVTGSSGSESPGGGGTGGGGTGGVGPPGAPVGQTTTFTETWDAGNFAKWTSVQNHSYEGSASGYDPESGYYQTIVSTGADHTTALRTEVRDGDTAVGSHERAELSSFGKSWNDQQNDERWYEFDVKFGDPTFSPTWSGGSNDWLIFFQWHQVNDPGAPALAMSVHNDGKVYLEREPDSDFEFIGPLWTITSNTWYHVVVHVKWSPNSAVGFIECHVDGVEVYAKTSKKTQYSADTQDYYVKLGTYRRSSVTGTTVVFHDNLRISGPPEVTPGGDTGGSTGGGIGGGSSTPSTTPPPSGVRNYVVYRDGAQLATTTLTSYVDTDVTNGTTYAYTVSAVDVSLNESGQSSSVNATPAAAAVAGVPLLPGRLAGGRLEVAIAWGADLTQDESTWAWTDITADVRHDPGISTSLGRNDESSTSNPAEITLVLDNSSGDYSLGGRSRRYPYVRRNTPVRVRIDPGDTAGGRIVFLGFADGFTPGWDTVKGTIPVVALSASGSLRRLGQGDAPVKSAYRRIMEASSTVVAYWPLEEGESATYAPAVKGGGNLVLSVDSATPNGTPGRPDWQADRSFDCSAPLPRLGRAYLRGDVLPYTNTFANQVRCLLSIPDGGLADGTVLMHVSMTGTIHRWDITYGITNGVENLGLYRYNASDGSLNSSSIIGYSVNGKPGRLSLETRQSGADIVWTLSFTPAVAGAFSQYVQHTLTGRTAGIVRHIEINPHNADISATIGHLTVENQISSAFADTDALIAHAGELATTSSGRLQRLCDENAVPYQQLGASGTVAPITANDEMGPQLAQPLLTLLHECEASDQGQLWDGRNAGLAYTTRRRRELGRVGLTIDASAGELAGEFAPVDDDQRNRNKVTVTRLHGVTTTHEDTDGPLGTAAVGIYDDAVTINNGHDEMALQYAQWLVHLGTTEGYRYPSVTVDLAASPALASSVLGLIPGSRIDVTGLDDTLAGFNAPSVSLIVEGIAHEINPRRWRATFRCSLAVPWMVGEVAEETGDTSDMVMRLDTDGSELAADYPAGTGAISVLTTRGALWTVNADDYPLYLSVGGVRVRATSCVADVVAPATTRVFLIDALPVARPAGATVELWEPRVVGLG